MIHRDYKYSRNSAHKIISCGTVMQSVCYEAMVIARKRKMHVPDFGISGGLRTLEEQQALYAIGRTVDVGKPVVTYCDGVEILSEHQSGNAVDIYCYVGGKTNYDEGNLALVASCFFEAAMRLGVTLRWGGNFQNSVDGPHFEVLF